MFNAGFLTFVTLAVVVSTYAKEDFAELPHKNTGLPETKPNTPITSEQGVSTTKQQLLPLNLDSFTHHTHNSTNKTATRTTESPVFAQRQTTGTETVQHHNETETKAVYVQHHNAGNVSASTGRPSAHIRNNSTHVHMLPDNTTVPNAAVLPPLLVLLNGTTISPANNKSAVRVARQVTTTQVPTTTTPAATTGQSSTVATTTPAATATGQTTAAQATSSTQTTPSSSTATTSQVSTTAAATTGQSSTVATTTPAATATGQTTAAQTSAASSAQTTPSSSTPTTSQVSTSTFQASTTSQPKPAESPTTLATTHAATINSTTTAHPSTTTTAAATTKKRRYSLFNRHSSANKPETTKTSETISAEKVGSTEATARDITTKKPHHGSHKKPTTTEPQP